MFTSCRHLCEHNRANTTVASFPGTAMTHSFGTLEASPVALSCGLHEALEPVVRAERNLWQWSGIYSDSVASGGYGGNLYLCASQAQGYTLVEGLYSEVRVTV